VRRIAAAVVLFLAVAALAGSTGAAASAAPSASPIEGTWGSPEAVPGLYSPTIDWTEVVTSVSCTGPGDCSAGGAYQAVDNGYADTDAAYVVSEVNGKWETAEQVPGTAALNTGLGAATASVSCAWPGNCVAVGYYAYLYGKSGVGVAGFVDSQVDGTWGTARPVPALSSAAHFAEVTAVSCAPAVTAAARKAGLNCVAGGVSDLTAGRSTGFVLPVVNGAWGTARAVPGPAATPPGSAVTAVSCPFRGTCGIGGYYAGASGHRQAFVANEVKGTWSSAQQVPGTAALNAGGDAAISSVSCTAVGACAAAGTYQPAKGPGQLFVVDETAGRWQRAVQLPGSGKLITASGSTIGEVSCASAASCTVGGTLQTAAAVTRGFLAGETSGRWGALYVVPGGTSTTITAVSCPAPGYCAAGGQRDNPSSASFPASVIVLDEAAGHWGKTVALNSHAIIYPGSDSVHAISCAAPRSCAAGGEVPGYQGNPYGFVANETPVK